MSSQSLNAFLGLPLLCSTVVEHVTSPAAVRALCGCCPTSLLMCVEGTCRLAGTARTTLTSLLHASKHL